MKCIGSIWLALLWHMQCAATCSAAWCFMQGIRIMFNEQWCAALPSAARAELGADSHQRITAVHLQVLIG